MHSFCAKMEVMNRSIMTDNILLQKLVSDLTYMHWSFSELEWFYDHQKFIKAYPLSYNMYSYFMNLKKKAIKSKQN